MSLLFSFVEISATILTFIFFCIIANTFFSKSQNYHISKLILIGGIELSLSLIPSSVLPNTIFSLFAMLLSFIVLLLFFNGSLWKKVLVLLLFNVTDILITNFVTNLFLLSKSMSTTMLFSNGSFIRVLYIIVTYTLELSIVYYLHHFHTHQESLSHKSFWISVLFFSCDFIVAFLLHIILIYYASKTSYLNWICLLIALCLLSTTLIGLYLLKIQQREQSEHLEMALLRLQLEEQEQHILESEKQYEHYRIMKHDMKHLLLNYHILLNDGKVTEVQENISGLINEPAIYADIKFTDNRLLDALLHSKQRQCVEKNIIFKNHIQLNPLYENIQIMILISNLLDNAIEASIKEPLSNRLIRFELIENSNNISIITQNYISTSVLADNPNLQSKKPHSLEHGLGLKSIRMIVERQNGILDFYEEKNMFCVHILLPSTCLIL